MYYVTRLATRRFSIFDFNLLFSNIGGPHTRELYNDQIKHSIQVCSNVAENVLLGAIQVLRNADGCKVGGGGGVKFSGKKHYEGVRFNVISVTRGWVGVQFPGKKRS